ncbi:MAG: TIGR00730 family Rossman fold protein [Rhodospirillaceae bacterium]|nr:TIGR00730 family Rossman fold protein [Rhodospirillaceae bacterium]OUT78966.1 MAG: Rossman fold protein, TIGR00730 family [Rhodospirillaceae bacterium TMED23]|tara:strand:- start:92 stop:646 length:555 start_codon:yes stop_codon:yes gene_type:complete
MKTLESITVYCGAKLGNNSAYALAARELGNEIAKRSLRLIYGGGKIGLMGEVANSVLSSGGEVTGVIPHFLNDMEVKHTGLTECITVNNMHERKFLMYKNSDAFIILPGGFGTLDECMEILTWKQLGLHNRPIVILDIEGCWKSLKDLLTDLATNEFANKDSINLFSIVNQVSDVFHAIEQMNN